MPTKVLVADDDELVREAVSSALEEAGYGVLRAADGGQAWRSLEEEGADMAVLDLNMPEIDGMELTRMIRESPGRGGMPILMLTVREMVEDQLAGYGRGADDYLTKPFDGRVLVARLRLLERRILGREGPRRAP